MSSVKSLLKEIGRSRSTLEPAGENNNNNKQSESEVRNEEVAAVFPTIVQEMRKNRDDGLSMTSSSTLKDMTESRSSFDANSDELESQIERLVNKKLEQMMLKQKANNNITEATSSKKVQFMYEDDEDDLKKPSSLFSAESDFKATNKADEFYKDHDIHEFKSSTHGYPEKLTKFDDYSYYSNKPTTSSAARNRPTTAWNEKNFIRSLFAEVDANGDGQLSNTELLAALRRGFQFVHGANLTTTPFDYSTVDALILKHDRSRDRLIDQFEFATLYSDLNAKYLQFVELSSYKIAVDGVGYASPNEIIEYARSKGFDFKFEMYEELIQDIMLKKGFNRNNGIDFDGFVRLTSRLEYLKELFLRENRGMFERFVRDRFYAEISYF